MLACFAIFHPPPSPSSPLEERGGEGEIGHRPKKHAFQEGFTTCWRVLRFPATLPPPPPHSRGAEGKGEIGHKPEKNAYQEGFTTCKTLISFKAGERE